jgi:hypothetical protein
MRGISISAVCLLLAPLAGYGASWIRVYDEAESRIALEAPEKFEQALVAWSFQFSFGPGLSTSESAELHARSKRYVLRSIYDGLKGLEAYYPELAYLVVAQARGMKVLVAGPFESDKNWLGYQCEDPKSHGSEIQLSYRVVEGMLAFVVPDRERLLASRMPHLWTLRTALRMKPTPEIASLVEQVLEQRRRYTPGTIFHEFLHVVGLPLPGTTEEHNATTVEALARREKDAVYSCAALLSQMGLVIGVREEPSGPKSYELTRTACATCLSVSIPGTHVGSDPAESARRVATHCGPETDRPWVGVLDEYKTINTLRVAAGLKPWK